MPALEGPASCRTTGDCSDEGVDVDVDRLRRAHALLMLEFAGLTSVPFELLEAPPTDEGLRIATERAAAARFMLDLRRRHGLHRAPSGQGSVSDCEVPRPLPSTCTA